MKRHKKSYLYFFPVILGLFFIISPVLLYWFIHGSYNRYLRIINGPYPFRNLGGGPYQLWLYVLLILIGMVLIGVSLNFKNKN